MHRVFSALSESIGPDEARSAILLLPGCGVLIIESRSISQDGTTRPPIYATEIYMDLPYNNRPLFLLAGPNIVPERMRR